MSVAQDYPLLSQLPSIGNYPDLREQLGFEANAALLEIARLRVDNRRLARADEEPDGD